MDAIFELAPWSSMRLTLCLQLEEPIPDRFESRWQVELMKLLCLVAYNSEIYDAVGCEGWLRTTVTLSQLESDLDSDLDSDLGPCIFSEGSAECEVMREIAERYNTINETYWRTLHEHHPKLLERVKIHSNIIPREAYREKLSEVLRRQQHGSSPSRTFRREFYPIGVLADAVEESTSISEKTKEWRRNGGQCVLATHLHTRNVPHAAPRPAPWPAPWPTPWPAPGNRLRGVKVEEVHIIRNISESGDVQEVSWRNGIYARKLFYFPEKFETEHDVALRVCHPHVIRPWRTFDVDCKPCLLMELLEGHLYRFFIEKDIEGGENPLFEGSVESLDVLLQIARGLKSLHDAHVVHGDLKPRNIFFSHFEIAEHVRHFFVKIADFGEAQVVLLPEDFTPSRGTTQYAAPEVLRWTRPIRAQDNLERFCDPEDPDVDSLPYKLDIYGFGCIAYEVLTGQPVYGGNVICGEDIGRVATGTLTPDCSTEQRRCTVWQNKKEIYPRDLMYCLESCWALDPSERPSSAELCEVLLASKAEMQYRVSWKERKKYAFWNFLIPSLIAFICCFAASYTNLDAEKFLNWLANLAVNTAAVALVVFVCICCQNYSSGKLKRN